MFSCDVILAGVQYSFARLSESYTLMTRGSKMYVEDNDATSNKLQTC